LASGKRIAVHVGAWIRGSDTHRSASL